MPDGTAGSGLELVRPGAVTVPSLDSRGRAPRVAVVGGGISGIACARALHEEDVEVVVLDRGRRLGGRMAVRTLRDTGLAHDGHAIDVGAAYLTATSDEFCAVVEGWVARGLLREWTDTLTTAGPDGRIGSTTGPMRYAAQFGLRSLVEDLAADLPVVINPREDVAISRTTNGVLLDEEEFDSVVLAMPGPQARDILGAGDPAWAVVSRQPFDPSLTLVAAYHEVAWEPFDAMFVNGSIYLTIVADDGRRRGDGAPVLVAHSAPLFAARHLDDPMRAAPALVEALTQTVGVTAEPAWVDVRRWSLAQPRHTQDAPFWFDGVVGLCGDAWGAASRVETAWASGDALGRAIAERING